MTVRITSWRGVLPRAGLLAVIIALVPLPAVASNGGTDAKTAPIKASMARIVARDLSTPAAASAVRPARQGQTAGGSPAFFKSRPGMVALVVMVAGTGYALYSAQHDRITSAGKK